MCRSSPENSPGERTSISGRPRCARTSSLNARMRRSSRSTMGYSVGAGDVTRVVEQDVFVGLHDDHAVRPPDPPLGDLLCEPLGRHESLGMRVLREVLAVTHVAIVSRVAGPPDGGETKWSRPEVTERPE